MSPKSILSSSLALSEDDEKEESSSKDILNTPSLGERTCCLWRCRVGEAIGLGSPAYPGPKGNPCVDDNGAVRGPLSNDDIVAGCRVVCFLGFTGVAGGVRPSASVVSSQMGKAP